MMKLTDAELARNYTIVEKCERAAEVWKVMAKHCLDLKVQGRPVGDNLQYVVDSIDTKPVLLGTEWVSPEKRPEVAIEAATSTLSPAPPTHAEAAPTSSATIPIVPATHVAAAGFESYQLKPYVPQLVEVPTTRSEAVAITGLRCK